MPDDGETSCNDDRSRSEQGDIEDRNVSANGEQLSAFLDDELDSVESEFFVRRLGKDGQLRETALRYSLIGDALRDEVLSQDPRAIARAVAAEGEIHGAGIPARPGARWLKPVAGAAVAATVAVVAVLSLQPDAVENIENAAVTVPAAPAVAGLAAPAEISRRAGTVPDRLSEYYLTHSEYTTVLGGQGQLARIVTNPANPDESGAEEPASDPDSASSSEKAKADR